ncbi:hypothetical protein PSTG_13041 [Puccinia striiformis f. sp. tritici PST-78]|uniref:Uncharacterized protein n=1 Tax=Puccinia striiformis f. sp. tritici PST-78 TaxID=1165861 RepID=A0A0L0V2T5_9BASI|nr:hypothetical protein PSTG_13041 [Puccinia striiformis f. sp. tritici PST-78]
MYWCTGIKGLACRLAKAKAGSGNEPQYSRCYGRLPFSLSQPRSDRALSKLLWPTFILRAVMSIDAQLSAVPVLSVVELLAVTVPGPHAHLCNSQSISHINREIQSILFLKVLLLWDETKCDWRSPSPVCHSRTTLRSTCYGYSGLLDMNPNNYTKPNQASQRNLLSHKAKLEAVHSSKYMESPITQGVSDKILLRGGVEVE